MTDITWSTALPQTDHSTVWRPHTKYRDIPAENIKFSHFIDLLFASSLSQSEIKDEIKKYNAALETGYMDWIEELWKWQEKDWWVRIQKEASWVNDITMWSELEHIFVDCIE